VPVKVRVKDKLMPTYSQTLTDQIKIKIAMMSPSQVSTRDIRPCGLGRRVTKEEKTSEKDMLQAFYRRQKEI